MSGLCLGNELAESRVAPPQITQWMGTYMQEMGTDARLICRAQGPGSLEVVWMGPDDEVIEGFIEGCTEYPKKLFLVSVIPCIGGENSRNHEKTFLRDSVQYL